MNLVILSHPPHTFSQNMCPPNAACFSPDDDQNTYANRASRFTISRPQNHFHKLQFLRAVIPGVYWTAGVCGVVFRTVATERQWCC